MKKKYWFSLKSDKYFDIFNYFDCKKEVNSTNLLLKVSKIQNESLKSSFLPKYEQKKWLRNFILKFTDIYDYWSVGTRTPNEGINLKIWADVPDKLCFGRT